MKCTRCGTVNPDNSRFCGNCGANSQKPVFMCSKCGKKYEKKQNFCNKCGGKIETIFEEKKETEKKAKTSKPWDFKIESGTLLKYLGEDKHVVIPDSVETIGNIIFIADDF